MNLVLNTTQEQDLILLEKMRLPLPFLSRANNA